MALLCVVCEKEDVSPNNIIVCEECLNNLEIKNAIRVVLEYGPKEND